MCTFNNDPFSKRITKSMHSGHNHNGRKDHSKIMPHQSREVQDNLLNVSNPQEHVEY